MRRRRSGVSGRGAHERGASVVEYAALVVLAALVLGALVATGLPGQIGSHVGTSVCQIFQGKDCGKAKDARPKANGKKTDGEKKSDGKKDGGCGWRHPFNCGKKALNGAKHVVGGAAHAVKDQGTGIKKLVTTDPRKTIKAFGIQAWHETPIGAGIDAYHSCSKRLYVGCIESSSCALSPAVCAVEGTAADDATKQDIKNGRYGDAIGRDVWNVGSLFIPTKVPGLSKVAKVARGAEEGGNLARAAGDAGKAADRASQLADKGDVAGARRAADEARRKADEAEKEAKKSGCKTIGLGEPAVRPLITGPHFGRYAVALPAAPGPCENAQAARDAADAAKEAADWAPRNKKIDEALKKGRFEDADKLIDQGHRDAGRARARAKARPTEANKEAARRARSAVEAANRRVIDKKIDAALKSGVRSTQEEGKVGQALRDNLVQFQKKYGPNGSYAEIDAETPKAIIESKTGGNGSARSFRAMINDINKKMARPGINETGKPWIVYAPDLDANKAGNLAKSIGATVVRTLPDLKNALRALGEPVK